jgi:hypothetical protein
LEAPPTFEQNRNVSHNRKTSIIAVVFFWLHFLLKRENEDHRTQSSLDARLMVFGLRGVTNAGRAAPPVAPTVRPEATMKCLCQRTQKKSYKHDS